MYDRYAELHDPAKDAGPGDHRRTAMQIVEDQDIIGKWTDKVVLVTGCTSGIGYETARAMIATGAKVYMTSRDQKKGEEALKDLIVPGRAEVLELKLDSFKSVRACAAAFQAKESKLNIMINNAGVMAIQERTLTEDGYEAQFATNHLGHFLLFQLLKPQLVAGSSDEFSSRVINLSSVGHTQSPLIIDDLNLEKPGVYQPWIGYGHAKTAVIYMANEVTRRYGNEKARASGKAILGLSLMPGGIRSGLQKHVDDFEPIWQIPAIKKAEKNAAQGAATTVWAAVEKDLEGVGAKYLENCQVSSPAPENASLADIGYAPWAFDEEKEKKLWIESCKMVGVDDD
jgi:NAD(P)-dependent dehydrogenase (short-subunit alcohol dehydrogenase family)